MGATQTSKIILTAYNKTDKAFGKVSKNLSALGGVAKVALGAVAAAGIGAGVAMAALGARSAGQIDTMAKVADKVGIAAESLQQYRFAAEQAANVSEGTFDMAMQRFSRRMGEAVQGTGELLPVLEQYGIAVTDAQGRTRAVEDVFRDYADAVAGAGSEQEQLRLAFKGFDSEGAAMVNLLREGADGLGRYAAEANSLGFVVSRFDASKVEQANDSLGRMGKAFEGVGNRIAVAAAPYVKMFTDLLVDGMTQSGWLTKSIGWMAEHTIDAVAGIADAWINLGKIWQVIKLGLGELVLATLDGLAKMEDAGIELYKFLGMDPPDTGPLRQWADEWGQVMVGVREDTLKELAKPLVGADIKAAFVEITAKMDAAAAEAAAGRPSLTEMAVVPTPTATAQAQEKVRESALSMLDGLRQANLAANDDQAGLIQYRLDQQLVAIEAASLNEAEAIEARKLAEQTAQMELAQIRRDGQATMQEDVAAALDRHLEREAYAAERNKQIWASGARGKAQIVGSVMGQMSALMESGSKKMFAVGKAAAIGETVIQTYRAAQGAYAALASIPYVGPALGVAAAAAAVASGMARVQAIKSQSFGGSGAGAGAGGGGGGGVGSSGGGGGGGADMPAMAAPANDAGPGRVVYVSVPSDTGMVSMDWVVNDLVPVINEAAGDGVDIRVRSEAA